MRFYLLQAFAILFISSQIHAQAPQEILSKAYSKCQSITHGKYSLVVRKKYMTVKDTSVVAINTTFQKYPADTVHPLLFHSTESHNNGYTISILYTGKEFVRIFPHDSTAEIMQSTRWATKIQSSIQSFFFFRPLTDVKSALLQYDTADIHYSISFKGMDTLRNEPCYAINVIEIPELDSTNPISVIKIVYRYWIRTDNYLPIRYIVDYEAVMNNDTLHQHEDFTLTSSTFDRPIDSTVFTLNSIPLPYRIREFVPSKAPLLLSNDTTAPEWTLNTIHNDTLTLKDLKGKLILLDFFYRSCAPCLLAMPGMQSLHTRYHDQGLRVIGVNPVDKYDEEFRSFLRKSGVKYPIAFANKDMTNSYRVSSYPTMYLIDTQGNIIYSQVGYSKHHESALEEIIVKNLPKK